VESRVETENNIHMLTADYFSEIADTSRFSKIANQI
jgi:hypothetical protein